MAHITEIHEDILYLILVLVATSDDGARGVARIAATCGKLMPHVLDSRILKLVNFQHLADTTDFRMHHHTNDLLCMSAVSGNQAAQSILGKALLLHDKWFWRMIMVDYQRARCGRLEPRLVLHHHNLVRTFILHATSKDMSGMCRKLVNYVITYAGFNAAHDNGLIMGIFRMCTYEAVKLMVPKNELGNVRPPVALSFGSFATVAVNLQPPHEMVYRDHVIEMFDELFPSALG